MGVASISFLAVKKAQQEILEHQVVQVAEIIAQQTSVNHSLYEHALNRQLPYGYAASLRPYEFVNDLSRDTAEVSGGLYRYRLVNKDSLNSRHPTEAAFLESAWAELALKASKLGHYYQMRQIQTGVNSVSTIMNKNGIPTLMLLKAGRLAKLSNKYSPHFLCWGT